MSSVNKHFDSDIAKRVGTDAAIIYYNILFWISKNEANGVNFHNGKYWTFNSVKAFNKMFDYLSPSQIKTCLSKLEKENLLEVGAFNKAGYDRTKWYSKPTDSSNGENSQLELSEFANPLDENRQPIPDNKPYNNNSIKVEKIDFEKLILFYNQTFKKKCKVFPDKAKKQFNDRIKEGYDKEDIKNVLINVSQNEWHIEKNYVVATLEFLSRSKTFETYSAIIPKKIEKGGHTNH